MNHIEAFKRGCDLAKEPSIGARETLSCENCAKTVAAERATKAGWQVRPPLCPDCLRWAATRAGERVADRPRVRIEPHGRYWAVYEGAELICLTVYRKGAAKITERLERDTGGGHGSR